VVSVAGMRIFAVLLLTLALPASAGAAVFHVDDSVGASAADCTVGTCKTIADALTQARAVAHAGPDTIMVAAGTYAEMVSVGNADDSGDVIQGVGDATVIAPTALPVCCAVVIGQSSSPSQDAITLRGLKVVTPAAVAAGKYGININATNVVLDHVTVEMHSPGTGPAIGVTGNHALLDHVTTRAAGSWSGPGVRGNGTQLSFTVRDSDLAGGGNYFGISTITAQGQPGPGSVTVQRTISRAGPSAGIAADLSDVTATVESSLFLGGSQEALFVSGANKPADVTLRNVTLDAGAPGIADGAFGGIYAGQNATVKLQSSIALEPMSIGGALTTIACTNSDVPDASTTSIACSAAGANSHHAPGELFGSGHALKPGSPALDTGAAGALGPLESATDLSGLARLVDGDCDGVARRDRGAYEFQPLPCPPVPPPSPSPPAGDGGGGPLPTADTTAPTLTLKLVRKQRLRGKRLTVKLQATIDEAGTIAVKAAGKRFTGRFRKLAKRGTVTFKLGLSKAALRSLRRSHRLKLQLSVTATDVAGNRRALTRTVQLVT
jgi:hypothetical protein